MKTITKTFIFLSGAAFILSSCGYSATPGTVGSPTDSESSAATDGSCPYGHEKTLVPIGVDIVTFVPVCVPVECNSDRIHNCISRCEEKNCQPGFVCIDDQGYEDPCVWDWNARAGRIKDESDSLWGLYQMYIEDVPACNEKGERVTNGDHYCPVRIQSPFHASDTPDFDNTSSFEPIDGWRLLKKDFGSSWVGMNEENPYFVLYNKYNGTIVFWVYIHDDIPPNSYNTIEASIEPGWPGHHPRIFATQGMIKVAIDDISTPVEKNHLFGVTTFGHGQWAYAVFPTDYDPELADSKHPTLKFFGYGIDESQVELSGTMDLKQHSTYSARETDTDDGKVLDIVGQAVDFAGEASKAKDWIDKQLAKTKKILKDQGDNADLPVVGEILYALNESKVGGFIIDSLGAIGFAGSVVSTIVSFFDDGSNKSPAVISLGGKMGLSGTIKTRYRIFEREFRIPGTRNMKGNDESPWMEPDFDSPVGVFSLRNTPVLIYEGGKYTDPCEFKVGTIVMFSRYKAISNLEVVINPHSNLRLREAYAAIVYTGPEPCETCTVDRVIPMDEYLEGNKKEGYVYNDYVFVYRTQYVPVDRFVNLEISPGNQVIGRNQSGSMHVADADIGVRLIIVADRTDIQDSSNSGTIVYTDVYKPYLTNLTAEVEGSLCENDGSWSGKFRDDTVGVAIDEYVESRKDFYLCGDFCNQYSYSCSYLPWMKDFCFNRNSPLDSCRPTGNLVVNHQWVTRSTKPKIFHKGQSRLINYVEYRKHNHSAILQVKNGIDWNYLYDLSCTATSYAGNTSGEDLEAMQDILNYDASEVKRWTCMDSDPLEPGVYRVAIEGNGCSGLYSEFTVVQ